MTTTIHNDITIEASPEQVWDALADLDGLAQFDPAVDKSSIVGDKESGLGAQRRCEVAAGRWFNEEITVWEPHDRLQFAIIECNLPTHSLTHTYTLTRSGTGTNVAQVMSYEMNLGPIGWALNKLMLRRKTDQTIKSFFAGLKGHVQAQTTAA